VQRTEKGQKQSLETLSAVASAFDVNVSDLSEENYVASQALDERIREAKTQIAQETQFYRILVTAVLVCTALKITNYFLPRKVTGPLWSLLSGEDLSYSGE
jgi:anti-sigma-K factor RskA